MNDHDRLLASAALDGDMTDEERARVEADPALRAEVDRLARVRDLVGTTPAPDPARRESVLAAALAAAEEPAAPVAPVVPIGAGRRRRWLAPVAAAVVAIGVGAVVATQGGGDQDGDDAALVAPTDEEIAADRLTAAEAAADTAAPASSEQAAAAPSAAGDVAERDAGGASDLTLAAEATAAASEGRFGLDADGLVVLLSIDDLVAFATTATATTAPTAGADRPRCDGGRWVGDAHYDAAGEDRIVEVFVDADRVLALDGSTCEIVVEARN